MVWGAALHDMQALHVRTPSSRRLKIATKKRGRSTVVPTVKSAASFMQSGIRPITMTLVRFRYLRISHIDLIHQKFEAQFLVVLCIKGGANDPYLSQLGEGSHKFPKPESGPPRPSARWFANQLTVGNSTTERPPLDDNVYISGDDIFISRRYQGEFFEVFEMDDFPFDRQELSIELAVNCRVNGATPCMLVIDDAAQVDMSEIGFRTCTQQYELDNRMTSIEVPIAPPDDVYPTVRISTRVYRDPTYIVINMCVPMILFMLTQMLQFFMPTGDQEGRLAVTLTVLLTANAYKTVTLHMTPNISYLTLVDKYVQWMSSIMILNVAEGAAVGLATYIYKRRALRLLGNDRDPMVDVQFFFDVGEYPLSPPPPPPLAPVSDLPTTIYYWPALIDLVCLIVSLLLVLLVHAWFGWRIHGIRRVRRRIDTDAYKVHVMRRELWEAKLIHNDQARPRLMSKVKRAVAGRQVADSKVGDSVQAVGPNITCGKSKRDVIQCAPAVSAWAAPGPADAPTPVT